MITVVIAVNRRTPHKPWNANVKKRARQQEVVLVSGKKGSKISFCSIKYFTHSASEGVSCYIFRRGNMSTMLLDKGADNTFDLAGG